MTTLKPLHSRPLTTADRQQLKRLLQLSSHVHQHLDWFEPEDWIGSQPFLGLEGSHWLSGVLACPPDPEKVAWIRLFAVAGDMPPHVVWNKLWPGVQAWGTGQGITVAAIPIHAWFREILVASQFEHLTDVVLLSWDHYPLPTFPDQLPFTIRDMNRADIPAIHRVDAQGFDFLWQHSESALESAWMKSAIATVAQVSGEIIAYQISTASSTGGHLARLAVRPDWQGCGVGTALVRHLLTQFHLWGSQRVTVNTQANNHASLALYQKLGFRRTNEDYPVYHRKL
jgi:ribosomal protein S18 acetylase RimI-like enzyme